MNKIFAVDQLLSTTRFDMHPPIAETKKPASSSSDEDDSSSFKMDPPFLEPESKTRVKKQKKKHRVREQPAPTSAPITSTSHIASGTGRRSKKFHAAAATSPTRVATGEEITTTNGRWITVASLSNNIHRTEEAARASLFKRMAQKLIAKERAKKGSN